MELVAQEQTRGLTLVETDCDNSAAAADGADRFVERSCAAGALEGDGDAVRAMRLFQPARNILVRPVDRHESQLLREREPLRKAIDRVYRRRTGGARHLREDQPDR